MKTPIILMVEVMFAVAIGCSDDGVYTPVEQTDPPPAAECDDKAGCPDAGDEMDAGTDATAADAGK